MGGRGVISGTHVYVCVCVVLLNLNLSNCPRRSVSRARLCFLDFRPGGGGRFKEASF